MEDNNIKTVKMEDNNNDNNNNNNSNNTTMSTSTNNFDFISKGATSTGASKLEVKIGATDWNWTAINPTEEEYAALYESKGYGIGPTYPEFFKVDKNGNKMLRIQLFLDVADEEDTTKGHMNFFLYNEIETARSGKVKFVDGLKGSSYLDVIDGKPNMAQALYSHEDTLTPLYKGESDFMEFLLSITPVPSVNRKLNKDYETALQAAKTAQNLDPTIELPTKPTYITIDKLRPTKEVWDTLFNSNDNEEVERAYKQVMKFYQDMLKEVNSNGLVVKVARGLTLVGSNVYGVLYTRKCGNPGQPTATYDPNKQLLKDINANIKYLSENGKDVPYYNTEENLAWTTWNNDKTVFNKSSNNSMMTPGNSMPGAKPNMPGMNGGMPSGKMPMPGMPNINPAK